MPQGSRNATNLSIWRDHSSDVFWRKPEFHLTCSSFFPPASLEVLCIITPSSEYPIRPLLSHNIHCPPHVLGWALRWLSHSELLTAAPRRCFLTLVSQRALKRFVNLIAAISQIEEWHWLMAHSLVRFQHWAPLGFLQIYLCQFKDSARFN